VYTVRIGTLFEGESTNPEAVGTEFTKSGEWSIKGYNFLGAKHLLWRCVHRWYRCTRRDGKRQSM